MATAPAPTTAAPAPPTEDAAAAVPVPSASVPRGQVDLVDFIDWTGVECLNQDPAHGIANALKHVHREDEGLHLASHSNEQLLIHIPFVQAVNLHSALFKGPEEEGPKTVKLFSNREHIGSSNLSGFPPSDSVDLCSTHLLESKPMTLNHVKFQNVRSLTILIKDNQTGVNITQIQKIQLYGTTEIKEHHKTEDENRAKKMEVTESQKTARNNRCDVMAEKSALTAPTSGLGMLDNKNLATFTGPRNPLEVEAILTRILLRVPPKPSALLCASAVCKSWMSIVSAPQFFDKFVKFHKTPPLIGLLQDFRFLPILDPPDRGLHVYLPGDWKVKDCHHGLVLLQPKLCNLNFRVVDPMTHFESSIITVKVELPVCMAVAVVRDGGVSFRIVVLLNEDDTIYASIYSSASEQWSNSMAVLDTPCSYGGGFEPPTHVGNSLCWIYSNDDDEIVRYDLNRNILVIDAVPERADTHQWLVVSENNGLACLTGDNIEFWNKEAAEWKHCRSIPLSALLPQDLPPRDVHIRGADLEHGVMFLGTEWQQRILMVNLESMDIQQFVDYPQFSRYTFPYSNFHPAAALPHSYKKKGAPAKPKEVKKEDPKDDDPKPVVEAPNPLDLLPPSKMVLDEWKRLYKDSKSNFHEVAVKGLWDMYDPEGYSLWFCDYKYQEENTVSDVSLNKVTGFLEQMDPCRKYAFGKMLVIGSEAPFKLKGLWLFRGQEIPKFVMEEVKDMEMYEWTKVDISDEAHKERANAMIEDLEPFEGETLLDAKCFQ